MKKLNINVLKIVMLIICISIFKNLQINAAITPVTSDFSKINYEDTPVNYIGLDNGSPTNKIQNPSIPNSLPIKEIWGNYIRDGKITSNTTKIYLIMNNGNMNLPVATKGNVNISKDVLVLLLGPEIGATLGSVVSGIVNVGFENNLNKLDISLYNNENIEFASINNSNSITMNSNKTSASFDNNKYYFLSNSTKNSIVANNDSTEFYIGVNTAFKANILGLLGISLIHYDAKYMSYMEKIKRSILNFKPSVNTLNAGSDEITGSGVQIGDTISFTFNNKAYTTTVKNNGTWSIKLDKPVKNTDIITLSELPMDNTFLEKDTKETTTVRPSTLNNLSVNPNELMAGSNTISGTGMSGQKVEIKIDGNDYSGIIDENGNWLIRLPKPANAGQNYSLIVSDDYGNTGTSGVKAVGIKSVSTFKFKQTDLKDLDYNKPILLDDWDGIIFDDKLTNKINRNWRVYMGLSKKFEDKQNHEIPINLFLIHNNKKQLIDNNTPVPIIFDNNYRISDDKTRISFINNSNIQMDVSNAKGYIKAGNYTAGVTLTMADVPN